MKWHGDYAAQGTDGSHSVTPGMTADFAEREPRTEGSPCNACSEALRLWRDAAAMYGVREGRRWDGCRGLRSSEKEQKNPQTVTWHGVGRVGTRKI